MMSARIVVVLALLIGTSAFQPTLSTFRCSRNLRSTKAQFSSQHSTPLSLNLFGGLFGGNEVHVATNK